MGYQIARLGKLTYKSPLHLSFKSGDLVANFVEDNSRIIVDHSAETICKCVEQGIQPDYFEVAGPRDMNYFDGDEIRAAIVTCGGLCPGLNDVIRSLVMQLYYHYKVKEIIGVRYGFKGMSLAEAGTSIPLSPDIVSNIHIFGGSYLGSSRGPQSEVEMADFLQRRKIRILFVIGGDGSMHGALAVLKECERRDYEISIIGIPKTIDNDILFIDRSFGFSTAVERATDVLQCAHVEARGAENGIGLVKLMGRESGFIAARSTLASGFVNFVLIPEVPFDLHGENGFLNHLEKRILHRGHAVIAVAEGAGQNLFKNTYNDQKDPSGNIRLHDIGVYLKEKILEHFKSKDLECTLKYFDPSYIIRSAPANTEDNVYCTELAQNAVHAAFAGRTKAVIGSHHDEFVMIPMDLAVSERKKVNPDGPEWLAVLQSTGQPPIMKKINNQQP